MPELTLSFKPRELVLKRVLPLNQCDLDKVTPVLWVSVFPSVKIEFGEREHGRLPLSEQSAS